MLSAVISRLDLCVLSFAGSIIPAGYVKWLEQAGARVAVIPFNAPHDVLDQLFDSINGLLFTGGGLTLGIDTLFFNQALYMFNKAMAANDAGGQATTMQSATFNQADSAN